MTSRSVHYIALHQIFGADQAPFSAPFPPTLYSWSCPPSPASNKLQNSPAYLISCVWQFFLLRISQLIWLSESKKNSLENSTVSLRCIIKKDYQRTKFFRCWIFYLWRASPIRVGWWVGWWVGYMVDKVLWSRSQPPHGDKLRGSSSTGWRPVYIIHTLVLLFNQQVWKFPQRKV